MKCIAILAALACFIAIFPPTNAVIYSPWLPRHQYGPLYGGIQLLIADEEFHAELTWNETEYQLEETMNALRDAQTRMYDYEHIIEERLQSLVAVVRPNGSYKRCYRRHERAIAHFNRELLQRWSSCMQTLNAGFDLLHNETSDEIDFIRNAAGTVRNIGEACNLNSLKRSNDVVSKSGAGSSQAGVTLCVVTRIGTLDQRLFAASQLCLDVIASVALNAGGIEDDLDGGESCREFDALKQQFDDVYEDISKCMGYEAVQNAKL